MKILGGFWGRSPLQNGRLWLAAAGILTVFSVAQGARADQAQCLNPLDVTRAMHFLTIDTPVRKYCEPCGDTRWREVTISKITVTKEGEPCRSQIWLNDETVDLAYLYVFNRGEWRNLAMLLRFPVQRVSEVLPDGVPKTGGERR